MLTLEKYERLDPRCVLAADRDQNLPDHMKVIAELEEFGFRYDPAQVAAAERKSGPFKGVAEHVFKR